MLAIKDMAGLCKPFAAGKLVAALRDEIGIPIHFHTHDTSGASLASALEAARHGASVVDAAMAPFAGLTSQPNPECPRRGHPQHAARHRTGCRAPAAARRTIGPPSATTTRPSNAA